MKENLPPIYDHPVYSEIRVLMTIEQSVLFKKGKIIDVGLCKGIWKIYNTVITYIVNAYDTHKKITQDLRFALTYVQPFLTIADEFYLRDAYAALKKDDEEREKKTS